MVSFKRITGIAVVLLLMLTAACSGPDEAMPLTRENLLSYKSRLVESRNSLTDSEREKGGKSIEGAKNLFKKTFVKPMEDLGYSYDRTVRSFAESLIEGKLPPGDPELRAMAEGIVLMAKSTGEFALKNGFISHETNQVLDKIHIR